MKAPLIERSAELPLVWMRIEVCGGTSTDPVGIEGFARHAAVLARRGAGDLDRERFDAAIDELGASLTMSSRRDAIAIAGLCLDRNLDRLLELCADMMARPRMEAAEHEKLRRESRASIAELRDDDSQLVSRFFTRYVAPGHPYSRTALGTWDSLDRIDVDAARAEHRRRLVPANLHLGFAGNIDAERAAAAAEQLLADLPDAPAPDRVDVHTEHAPTGRRLFIIDKPDRGQCQVLMGHTTPPYAAPGFDALALLETAFGGMFTSRLMQEIRAKRGWSYDTGCHIGRTRGRNWMRINMSPTTEQLPDALALVAQMYESLASEGITEDELAFCRSYLRGSVAFTLATAEQRMRIALRNRVAGLADDHVAALPTRLDALTMSDVNAACSLLRPQDLTTVVVASADEVADALAGLGLGDPQVIAHDSY